MRLKFLVIGPKKIGPLSQDLSDAIRSRGHQCTVTNTRDFIFEIKNGRLKAGTTKIKNLFDFDIYLFRSFSKTLASSRIFIEELRLRRKTVIEECVSDKYINSKFAEGVRLIRKGLHYPKTFQIHHPKNIASLPKNIFPVIIKPNDGARGRGITIANDSHTLFELITSSQEPLIIQEYLKIDWDVRIFVVGHTVLGGMKRYVLKGDCRSNASLGSKTERFAVTPEIKKIALSATRALGYAVAGVDLIWSEKRQRWYVLEVNISPQWQAFKRVTGTDPARAIVEYVLKKHLKQKDKN